MNNYYKFDEKHYQEILDNMELYCPFLSESMIDWRPYDDTTVLVYLDDGTKALYDDMDQTFTIVRIEDLENGISEAEWRRMFSITLRKIMLKKNINQLELAQAAGMSNVTLSRHISQTCTPNGYTIHKIAKALECSPNDLVWFE